MVRNGKAAKRRSNCKGALQYVPELTWTLLPLTPDSTR